MKREFLMLLGYAVAAWIAFAIVGLAIGGLLFAGISWL
jgi:hypothetical protein